MPATEIRLHPTALTQVCDYAVYLREILKLRRPGGTNALVGVSVHRAYAYDLRAKVARAGLSAAEARELASDAFDFEWGKREVRLTEKEQEAGTEATRARAKDQVLGLAGTVHEKVTSVTEVAFKEDIEKWVELKVEGTPIVLVGRLDVHERGPSRLRDLKTASKKPGVESLSSSIQMAFYAMALEIAGSPVKELVLDVVTKTKEPKVWRLTTPAPTDFAALLHRIEILADSFERGVFKPIDPGGPQGWACSEGCAYWDDCPFGRARRKLVPTAKMEEV